MPLFKLAKLYNRYVSKAKTTRNKKYSHIADGIALAAMELFNITYEQFFDEAQNPLTSI